MNDCLCSWDSAWIFIISICFHLLKNQVKGLRFDTNVFTTITHGRYSLQVIFLARMYWAGKKSWVNKILNAEIIFMNGDINNLVISMIIVVVEKCFIY